MADLPANLPDLLRVDGLTVAEAPGWRQRGRPRSTGGFDPVGVLCHHTATYRSTSDAAVLRLLVRGRSDLPGPLCQLGLARDGTVHIIAAGRANHAGRAQASGTVAAGDGNALYVGIEAFNDGRGEPWPDVQYDAYVALAAALCRHVTGNSAQTVRGHKETSVTGKIDPTFDMDRFRDAVANHSPEGDDMTPAQAEQLDWIYKRLEATTPGPGETVGEGKNQRPARMLDERDGDYLRRQIVRNREDVQAIARTVAETNPNLDAAEVAAELIRQLTEE